MKAPFVGLPVTVPDNICAFSPDLDQPKCERQAVAHMAIKSDGWGVVGLASCAQHAPIARASGTLLAEHPFGALCAFPDGPCWS